MPIYEYQCPKCGKVFEDWVHISDAPETRPCPDCGTAAPHILSNTSFVLKGGGWYVTDYGYRKNATESDSTGQCTPPAASASGSKEASAPDSAASKPAPAPAAPAPKADAPKTGSATAGGN